MRSSPEAPPGAVRRRATVTGAFLEGWRRVLRAPMVTLGVVAATFLLALALAFALRGMIEQHLGSSLVSNELTTGWHAGWAAEFAAEAQGLGRTFTHEILGFGGTLANASDFIDHEPLNPTLAGAAAAYILLWLFLSGGILDRFARGRPIRTAAFFAACGVYFVRFLRLAVVIGAAYWALFRWLHPYLFGTLYNRWSRDMTAETDGVVLRTLLYLVFLAALMVVSLVADYAKVRAVVEDRHSMLATIGAAIRFIRRRPFRTIGLYLLNVVALLIIVRVWMQIAPSASAPTWSALLVAQVYLLARIWAKLAFMASEVVFFQGELAHATYTATPEPEWPDSPAAEALRRGTEVFSTETG